MSQLELTAIFTAWLVWEGALTRLFLSPFPVWLLPIFFSFTQQNLTVETNKGRIVCVGGKNEVYKYFNYPSKPHMALACLFSSCLTYVKCLSLQQIPHILLVFKSPRVTRPSRFTCFY